MKSGDRLLPSSSPWLGQQSASAPGVQWGCCPWSAGPGSGPPAHPWTPAAINQVFAFHLDVYWTEKSHWNSATNKGLLCQQYTNQVSQCRAGWRMNINKWPSILSSALNLKATFPFPTVCRSNTRAFCLIRLQLPWRRDELHLLCQLYNHR